MRRVQEKMGISEGITLLLPFRDPSPLLVAPSREIERKW